MLKVKPLSLALVRCGWWCNHNQDFHSSPLVLIKLFSTKKLCSIRVSKSQPIKAVLVHLKTNMNVENSKSWIRSSIHASSVDVKQGIKYRAVSIGTSIIFHFAHGPPPTWCRKESHDLTTSTVRLWRQLQGCSVAEAIPRLRLPLFFKKFIIYLFYMFILKKFIYFLISNH